MSTQRPYLVNYDWSKVGPVEWTEESTTTLQVDVESVADPARLRSGIEAWWADHASDPQDPAVTFAGGCWFPRPVEVLPGRMTAWICSRGEDAFDSIAHYATEFLGAVQRVDGDAQVIWTELPHTRG